VTLAVFNPDLEEGRHAMNGATVVTHRRVVAWPGPSPYRRRTVAVAPYSVRRYSWPQGLTPEQLETWLAFLEARGWTRDPFLIRDPRDVRRELEVGPGTGAATTFAMTTTDTDDDYRFYPLGAGADVVVAGGSPTTPASIDTDARTVTLGSPPAGAASVVLRYEPLRLVRVTADVSLELLDPGYFTYRLELEEVVRE